MPNENLEMLTPLQAVELTLNYHETLMKEVKTGDDYLYIAKAIETLSNQSVATKAEAAILASKRCEDIIVDIEGQIAAAVMNIIDDGTTNLVDEIVNTATTQVNAAVATATTLKNQVVSHAANVKTQHDTVVAKTQEAVTVANQAIAAAASVDAAILEVTQNLLSEQGGNLVNNVVTETTAIVTQAKDDVLAAASAVEANKNQVQTLTNQANQSATTATQKANAADVSATQSANSAGTASSAASTATQKANEVTALASQLTNDINNANLQPVLKFDNGQSGGISAWKIWLASPTTGPVSRTLPANPTDGAEVRVKAVSEQVSETNYVQIKPSSGDTIEGSASLELLKRYEHATLKYFAAANQWIIIDWVAL